MIHRLHQGQPAAAAGQALAQAQAALILLHGRGANAPGILLLAEELYHPAYAYLAPQAAGNSWYPYTFLAPLEQNEPWLSSALARVGEVVAQVEGAGIPAERIVLGGFSQGACLASEYLARNARRYGGLLAFSGGLIGPPGTPRAYTGDLEGTPVFLGCSDVDAHIPKVRVEETASVLQGMGAQVALRLYPGMGHTINADEIAQARTLLRGVAPD
ncbi:MAG TPA: dienelactone hydrolase family protein [Anaerolineae bacterium]|nr:dienelactone hydrolase family protein [Anaerolineae bacterium]HNU04555.1 dienelactone hydrolase family protein [Anaerolineae bacterium]